MRLSTVHLRFSAVLAGFIALSLATPALADLKPYKDDMFGYGKVLESADDGDYRVIDYDEMRDINGRDQEPERRVKRAYVTMVPKRLQANETVTSEGRSIDVARVGAAEGAAFSVMFIHGRGGDRRLGANDWSFGGNFNRLKNLATANGGVYYAPSVRTFDENGVADVTALIAYAKQQSPGRPVVLACASMGNFICWGITRDKQAVANLKGLVMMGGPTDATFTKSAAYKARLPIYFTHGSADSVYAAEDQAALYRSLHKSGYPTRFVLFNNGSHGTPVRMTDWREALNWIGLN